MLRRLRGLALAIASSLPVACAVPQEAAPNNEGIGYPSVLAALEDMRARNDVHIRTQDGWTIVEDQSSGLMTIWSFTPPDHPAHPAAIKRTLLEREGALQLEMEALCEARKEECDRLIAEFQELNQNFGEAVRKESKSQQKDWRPSAQQESRAENILFRFIEATDNGRYREAYQLYTQGMKALMSFERFVSHEQTFRGVSGGNPVRSNIRTTWYNDPPHAAQPGVYAAFDMECRFEKIDVCTETFILHEQDDGEFLVMRHERNYVK